MMLSQYLLQGAVCADDHLLTLSSNILDDGATSVVEMLFCTSLVALVGAGDKPSSSTRRLQIVNTKVS